LNHQNTTIRAALAAVTLGAALFCFWEPALGKDAPPLENRYPRLAAAYLVEVNGQPLWGAGVDRPMAPASLVKLMAALVVLEDYHPERWVVVSPRAANIHPIRLGLRAGDQVREADLLAAMLIPSANDGCQALVEHHGPGGPAFLDKMNGKAQTLGLTATRFANPCGFDSPGQQSTARDLARLAREALRHPVIARLAATQKMEITTRRGKTYSFRSGNALLRFMEGADGVKTGYTQKAGKCLILSVTRETDTVLVVMLKAKDRWWGAVRLTEQAFATLHPPAANPAARPPNGGAIP